MSRLCCRPSCASPATATMTYDYTARTVWVDPLDVADDPNGYDLCTAHADGTGVPRGWQRFDRRVGQLTLTSFGVASVPALRLA
jgi:hypothetical protein